MSQYKEISTLQYMGSKSRILPYICDPIVKNNAITRVIDLFAGTGSVGYALYRRFGGEIGRTAPVRQRLSIRPTLVAFFYALRF